MLQFDHLVLLSSGLDDEARRLTGCGFVVGPGGRHPALGTCNRLLMFETTYLELLAVERSTVHTSYYEDCLSEGGRTVGLALRGDAELAYRMFTDHGLHAEPPLSFSRPVTIDGVTRDARFRIVKLDPTLTPGAFVFVCQHETPELVWHDVPCHPSGARDLSTLRWAARDPEAAAQKFAEAIRAPLITACEVDLGNLRLVFDRSTGPAADLLAGIEFRGMPGPSEWRSWPGREIEWRVR